MSHLPTPQAINSWLHQTTTVHGLSVMILTAVAQATGGAPLWVVLGGLAGALVLLILPGQGDLAGNVAKLTQDVGVAIQTQGGKAAISALANDGVALENAYKPAGTQL